MDKNKANDIALMRYTAIAPLISGTADVSSLSEFFRDVSEKGIRAPDNTVRNYAPSTIEKWYLNYKSHGFNGLIPTGRSDCGVSRKIDDETADRIRYMKSSYPRLSASAIYRKLISDGTISKDSVSESTILRFINQLMYDEKLTTNQDMRRYERPHINEVWCGDSCVGPGIKTDDKKRRFYVIALIDDASRFIVGADVFFNDNFVNLMSVMKSAVSKYGRPNVFNFDNGSAYKNKQMELLAARIGSVINYCKPYTPTQKAKIERWFRTLRDQWMAALDISEFNSLDDVRKSLLTYVNNYNTTVHSSLKKSPMDRFFSEPELITRMPDDKIHDAFLLEIERRVSPDCVVTIDQTEYEVDYRFARQRITIRYSPGLEEFFIVEKNGSLSKIHLLNKHDNAFVKREKIHLSGGEI